MIISFEELKSEEHVLNLVFCLKYFDYSQSVGRWVVSRWIGGLLQEDNKYYPHVYLKKSSYEFVNKPVDNISHVFMSSALILNCIRTR